MTGRADPARMQAAASVLFDVQSTVDRPQDTPTQLRRRRQASLRYEPMADGRRDPWSSSKGARQTRTLHVEAGRRTAWIYGAKTFELLDAVGIERRQWDHQRRVWMIPIQFTDDLMAYAEWKQRRVVTCEAVER